MDLSKILSISGKSGLFKVVSNTKNAVIVESLLDQKRFPAFGHEKISSLEEISVFTTGEDLPLKDVFRAFYTKLDGKAAGPAINDNAAIKTFFASLIPDFDPERVYVSDIKKIINWYNLLLEHQLLDFTKKEEVKTEDETAPVAEKTQPEKETKTGAATKKPKKTKPNNK